jgi:hypothetical protein
MRDIAIITRDRKKKGNLDKKVVGVLHIERERINVNTQSCSNLHGKHNSFSLP